jgi:uncharacterized protein YndB with AHSA1/START domain
MTTQSLNSTGQAVVVERTIDAPVEKVWKALTDKEEMKQWYFDLQEFKAEPGFEFTFKGGTKTTTYLHLCQVKEVVPNRKLSYSWRYENEPGDSLVTFELFPDGNKTKVRITHDGLETFTSGNPDLARTNFEKGWTAILGTNLPAHFEKKN